MTKRISVIAVMATAIMMLIPSSAFAATTDLALTKTDSPDPVREGDVLTYTIQVFNAGPGPATGVVVTDQLEPQVAFVSVTPSQGTCDRNGHTVTCALGNLAPSANQYAPAATVTIRVRPKSAGQITNTATVAAGPGDTDP